MEFFFLTSEFIAFAIFKGILFFFCCYWKTNLFYKVRIRINMGMCRSLRFRFTWIHDTNIQFFTIFTNFEIEKKIYQSHHSIFAYKFISSPLFSPFNIFTFRHSTVIGRLFINTLKRDDHTKNGIPKSEWKKNWTPAQRKKYQRKLNANRNGFGFHGMCFSNNELSGKPFFVVVAKKR